VALTACQRDGSPDSLAPNGQLSAGDTAIWELEPSERIDSSADSFTAVVSRLGCSGGITGEVFAPTIQLGKSEIVVTFLVAPLDKNVFYNCPGNIGVPHEVELREQIGNRRLIDGSCLTEPALSTRFCLRGGARWIP
jgi:hypothetical protein